MDRNILKKLIFKMQYVGTLGMCPSSGLLKFPFEKANDYTRDDVPYILYQDLMRDVGHDFIVLGVVNPEIMEAKKKVKTVSQEIAEDMDKEFGSVVSVNGDEIYEEVECVSDAPDIAPNQCRYCNKILKNQKGRDIHENTCKSNKG